MPCYSLAYALDGGDAGEAPVFVPPPRPIGEDLDGLDDGRGFLGSSFLLFQHRIDEPTDFNALVENHGQVGHDLPQMEIALPFDPLREDFGRIGHRRAFRTPQIIRTSMLQEMLGVPTAQMIQDMARNQNGDIHVALSGPAAQLLFQGAGGFETGQLRHRMVSRYITARPGRSPSGRETGLSGSMSTGRRWSEEARVNAGPNFDERLAELVNHVVNALLPAAREAAKEEEAARLQKEAEEKIKAEQEARENAEAEEKARLEAEAALERQRAEEATTVVTAEPITAAEVVAEVGTSAQGQDMDASQADLANLNAPAAPTQEPSSSSNQGPRVTVMYHGESIDITDADIDPEFLNAVPEDIRDEILGNFVREQQRQSRPTRVAEAEMDMEFLNALPADVREDVLRGQAIAQITGAVDMDAASVLATLPEELRQTVLLEQEEALLETMPADLLAEANALRAQRMARRAIPVSTSSALSLTPQHAVRKPQYREIAQLLDKSGLANLVRLLFFIDQNRRTSLQQVLVNLSENNKSRIDLLNLLLVLLNGNKTDLSAIDRSFAQLSVRGTKPVGKGKQKEDSAILGALGDRAPEEHIVLQRTLDTLTDIVHANESASIFFLTEHEAPIGFHRTSSKKGKGKERQGSGTYYPFVQLLALLERPNLMHQAHSLDAISNLLCTVTKPLTILREAPKQASVVPEVLPPASEGSTVQPIPPVETPATESATITQDAQNTQQVVLDCESHYNIKWTGFDYPQHRRLLKKFLNR
jgi:E3 ubiquitin-protein ligase HUWE1